MLSRSAVMELYHIRHHIVPAVLVGKEAFQLSGTDRLAVAQVVIGYGQIALGGQVLHKLRVTVHVLGYAVG